MGSTDTIYTMYYVYILKNDSGQKYVGVTHNLKKRLEQHGNGETQTTRNLKTDNLTWYCAFANKARAYAFEKYLKSSSGHAFMNKRLL